MIADKKVFRYRYDYDPIELHRFIKDRYFPFINAEELEVILENRLRVNQSQPLKGQLLAAGDWIEYTHLRSDEEENLPPIDVLYEDEHILAICKPAGLPVTPSGRFYFNSIVIQLREKYQNDELSPLHRLDLETSGVLLFGKTKKSRRKLQPLFEKKRIQKRYQAIVFAPTDRRIIYGEMVPDENSKIYSKQILISSDQSTSETIILNQEPWGAYHRLWLEPVTGRTNQIRVHLASVGSPIVGDKKYYPDEEVYLDWFEHRDIKRIIDRLKLPRQALHCESLTFPHPFLQSELTVEDTTDHWENMIQSLL